MQIPEFTFRILLIFFPGILGYFIIDKLTVHKEYKFHYFLLQSFVLGLSAYYIYWVILDILNVKNEIDIIGTFTNPYSRLLLKDFSVVTIICIIEAFAISFFAKNKILNRFARLLHITNKFGERDVWGYLFISLDTEWIYFRDHKNNLVYRAWVQAFSDDSINAELLLKDVTVFDNLTELELYSVDTVYLSRDRNEFSIEIIDYVNTDSKEGEEPNDREESTS